MGSDHPGGRIPDRGGHHRPGRAAAQGAQGARATIGSRCSSRRWSLIMCMSCG